LSKAITALAKVESESRWRPNMRVVLETTLLSLLITETSSSQNNFSPEPAKIIVTQPPKQTVDSSQSMTASQKPAGFKEKMVKEPKVQSGSTDVLQPNLEQVKAKWGQVMEAIKHEKRTIHAFLTESEPSKLEDQCLVLYFKKGYTFHKEKVENQENRKMVEKALENVMGYTLHVVCQMEGEAQTEEKENPVQKVMDFFGSDIVVIKE
jgi:DNA polymerase-3 subunit gamma/tau